MQLIGAVEISDSLQRGLDEVVAFLPRLVGFLIILLIGWLIARAVKALLVKALQGVGIEALDDFVQAIAAYLSNVVVAILILFVMKKPLGNQPPAASR
jgi:ABC-type proline/glycine betaine transport system permease subunit